jgi:hypothetical protein
MAATATVEQVIPAESIVSKLGDLSAADLVALKQLLGVETPVAVEPKRGFNPEADLPPDEKLAQPVTFWNAKYPNEKLAIPGRAKGTQFWGGTFQAKTSRELAAARSMGRHVHEGDDLVNAMECPTCHITTSNTTFFMEHVATHAK